MNKKDISTDRVRQLYDRGLSDLAIAAELGVSGPTIKNRRILLGLSGRHGWLSRITPERLTAWVDQGLTFQEIGGLCGVGKTTVSTAWKRLGLPPLDDWRKRHLPPIEGQLLSVFIGSMLGDGSLLRAKNGGKTKYSEAHCAEQEEYLRWKASIWGSWVTNTYSRTYRGFPIITFDTFYHNDLTAWRDLFYPTSPRPGKAYIRKSFPGDVVDLVTPQAVAVWYMDDGTAAHYPTFTNHSDPSSMETLCLVLKKFGIKPTLLKGGGIQAHGYRNADKLLDLIGPFAIPCMRYKFHSGYQHTKLYKEKRIPQSHLRDMIQGDLTLDQMAEVQGVSVLNIKKELRRHGLKARSGRRKANKLDLFEFE